MAKNKDAKAEKPKVIEVPKKEARRRYFPMGIFLFGLVLIALAVVNYFQWFAIPRIVADGALLLVGLWVIKTAMAKGSYARRKDIFKRYI